MNAAHKPIAPDNAELYLSELIFRPSDPERSLSGHLEVDASDYPVYPAAPVLLAALRRLSFAARCRDNTMGDPCRLIEVKAELLAASKHADEVIARVTGGAS